MSKLKSRYILSEHAQGTPGWIADRLGKLTGSNAESVLSKGKTKGTESVMRRNLRQQLALERLTLRSEAKHFGNMHTERGTEDEPFARMAYESFVGVMVSEAGFAYLPGMPVGCSVDGFVEVDGMQGIIELKCPIPAIHWDYRKLTVPPSTYIPQITHNMWVTGAEFCDFTSYCDAQLSELQRHTIRYMRDEALIKAYEVEALIFLKEVADLEKEMRSEAAAVALTRELEAEAA